MQGFDRRRFLKGSSVAVGLVGAMTVVPGALPALAKSTQGAPAGSASHREETYGQSVDTDDTVVAHVRDAKEGQIDLFIGTKHFTVQDRALTNRIMSAAR